MLQGEKLYEGGTVVVMRKRLTGVSIVLSGLILFAYQAQPAQQGNSKPTKNSTATTTGKADPRVVEEVKELLAKHDKALNDQNLEAVLATFSTNPKTVVLGTGQGERFVGQDAIRQAYIEIFKDYDKGTLTNPCDWKTGEADESGRMAWLAATCQAKDSQKGVNREYVLNVSATVVKQDSGWRFVMLHMSNVTSGPPQQTPKN
jgi:ketosteroid isomerase-like protein